MFRPRHQRIIVLIYIATTIIDTVRTIAYSIFISICSCVIAPVITQIICVAFPIVGVGYFFFRVPDVGGSFRTSIKSVVYEVVKIDAVVI